MINGTLKSTAVPWPDVDPEIRAALTLPPEDLPKLTLIRLLRELDRRHMQLQDKIAFERHHKLVDYAVVVDSLKR